jgi:multidrug efflux system membrane fusion protein
MQFSRKYSWVTSGFLIFFSVLFINNVNAANLQWVSVTQSNQAQTITVEGAVEAVKSSLIAPQVSGGITALPVKIGDIVKAGQLLVRIDTRVANQQAATNQAQVAAAQAQLAAARQEFERKKRLNEKQYISQAALERAESDFKSAEAHAKALLAQAGMANVQTGLHTVNAPYDGVVSEVMVEVGDMAMPGKPLMSVYQPDALRIVVNVPQSQLQSLKKGSEVRVLIPAANASEQNLVGASMTVLPLTDVVSHVTKVRITLPQDLKSIRPGMFARAVFASGNMDKQTQLYVPVSAVVKRSELVAVYVLDDKGRPHLRQIRLGRKQGETYEVFAGLQVGEKVAIDPIAAANFK